MLTGALWLSEDVGEGFSHVVIQDNTASMDGGGIYTASGGNGAFLDNSTVYGNHAGHQGGGIYLGGESSDITSSNIQANTAGEGGGLYSPHNVVLTSSTVIGNRAQADGGGLDSAGSEGSAWFFNSTVSGNSARARGGGIYNRSDLELTGTTILLNKAPGGGGGIYDDGLDATLLLTGSAVAGNSPDNCAPPAPITGCAS